MHIVLIEVTISYVSFMVDTSTLLDIQSSFFLVECWLTVFIRIVRPLLITEMFAEFPFPRSRQRAASGCDLSTEKLTPPWHLILPFVFAFARLLFCIFRSDFWFSATLYAVHVQYQQTVSIVLVVCHFSALYFQFTGLVSIN